MTRLFSLGVGTALLASALLFSFAAMAQEKSQTPRANFVYQTSRETVLSGSVVSYTPNSNTPPHGPHATLQTGSGVVDVHLGDANYLEANHMALATGDKVTVIGESVAFGSGTQFVARVIKKGSQTLAVRSVRGFPLRLVAPRDANGKPLKPQGGAL